jgi:hypothetical protein
MFKDDALVVQETTEIVELLPIESRSDIDLVKAIAGSLREGQDRHDVEIKAIQLAHQRLESKVDKGFELIAKDLTQIKHAAEKDRIHASYAQRAAEQAREIAEQAWAKTQEVAIGVVKAEAKAESARDLAKESRKGGFGIDPYWGMGFTALLIFVVLACFTRVEKVPEHVAPVPQSKTLTCGVDVGCLPMQKPRPALNNGGV